ncbi:MAG: hypothetical protein U9O65_01840 [Thermotogota bacterium]|nr:hypothetical protein [Thermotogota bacterium]
MKMILIIMTDILLLAAVALLVVSAGSGFLGNLFEKNLEFSEISIWFSVNLFLLAISMQIFLIVSFKKIAKAALIFLSSSALVIYVYGVYQKGLGWLTRPLYNLFDIQDIPSLPGILMLLFLCLVLALSVVLSTKK